MKQRICITIGVVVFLTMFIFLGYGIYNNKAFAERGDTPAALITRIAASGGPINQAFDPTALDYPTTAQLKITPIKAVKRVKTVTINGNAAANEYIKPYISGSAKAPKIATTIDGVTEVADTVTSTQASLLNGIGISTGTLSPDFSPTTYAYTVSLPADTTTVTVTPDKAVTSVKSMTINGTAVASVTLSPSAGGRATATIVLLATDGKYKSTYTVTVIRDPVLTGITADGGNLSPVFNTAMTSYTINIPASTASVTLTATKADICTSLMINDVEQDSIVLSPSIGGSATASIVGSTDADTAVTYTVKVNRAAMITSIKSTSKAYPLSPAFNALTDNYTVTLPATVSSITITAAKATTGVRSLTMNGAAVTKITAKPPMGGNTLVTVVATSTDGVTKSTYTVTVKRTALIKDISVDGGTLTPAFSPATSAYTVSIPADTTSVSITPFKAATGVRSITINGKTVASVTLRPAVGGRATATIVAVATNRVTKSTYTVTVIRAPILTGITADGGTLSPSFNTATTSYSINIPASTASVTLTAAKADICTSLMINDVEQDSIVLSPAIGGSTTATIVGRTAAGTAVTYTVKVNRAAMITSIKSSSKSYPLSPAFNALTTNYTVTLPATVSSVTITAAKATTGVQSLTMNGAAVSKITARPPVGGNTVVTVVATSTDGVTKSTYTVTVKRAALIRDITVAGGTLIPAFSPTISAYTVDMPADTTSVTITPSKAASGVKSMTINGASVASVTLRPAVGGTMTATIIAKAKDGKTKSTYTVLVRHNVALSSITVDGGLSLEPAFAAATLAYSVHAPAPKAGGTAVKVTIKAAAGSGGTMTMNGKAVTSLDAFPDPGKTSAVVMIVVTPANGLSPVTYIVTVYWDVTKAPPSASMYGGLDKMTDFEVDEFEQIWQAGIVPDSWEGKDLNAPITGNEFYAFWRAFTVDTLGYSESELDSNCWNSISNNVAYKSSVDRGTAGYLYVFAFLQNQVKLSDYADFNACTAYNTGRSSLYCPQIAEYLDKNYNQYCHDNGGSAWGSTLCTITKDLVSGAPMFDVDVNGYGRVTDKLTYKEALQMMYRFSRSNRWVEPAKGYIPMDDAEDAIHLTEEQKAMAAAMPLPTYQDLPDWQGIWLTGDANTNDLKYPFEDDYRTFAELGFNHLRFSLLAKDLLNAEHTQFNGQILHSLDKAIGYAIKYGVHISLNIKVSADREADVLVKWSEYAYLKDMYRALAARYREIPSNALSFYIFFEPSVNDAYAATDPINNITDARYAQICYQLADVIWAQDNDRFITTDGITFGSQPSIALAEEGKSRTSTGSTGLGTIAQSFHYFSNGATWTNGFFGEAPSLTSWPMPYVQSVLMEGGQTITLNSNSKGFPKDTKITVNQPSNRAPASKLSLNADCTKEYSDSSVTFTLNEDTASLVLSSSANNYSYNEILTIWITYPFDAEKPIPIFGFFTDASGNGIFSNEAGDIADFNTNVLPNYLSGMPLKSILGTLVRRFEPKQIVVITCGGDNLNMDGGWASKSTAVTIAEDFSYTSDSAWCYNADYTRTFLKPWLDYEKDYDTETMLTEFGANDGCTESIIADILDERLGVMKENGISWSGIEAFGNPNGSVFDDYVYDGNYKRWRTHWYDVAQMDVLQKNMTTFDVSEVGRQTFTGSNILPAISVTFKGTKLTKGTDYTLTYFGNKDCGYAIVRILGIGNYAGMSRTLCFTISPFTW